VVGADAVRAGRGRRPGRGLRSFAAELRPPATNFPARGPLTGQPP
jgi:hypothetical protein